MSSKLYVDSIEPKTTGGSITFPESTTFSGTVTGAGKILQAVGDKVGTGTAVNLNTTGTWVGTGFGKSITPSSTSSKILIMCSVNLYNGLTGNYYSANIYRHTAAFTANGAVSGTQLFNNEKGFGTVYRSSGNGFDNLACFLIDSPNTTSEVYYNLCHKRAGGSSGITNGYNMDDTMVLLEVQG